MSKRRIYGLNASRKNPDGSEDVCVGYIKLLLFAKGGIPWCQAWMQTGGIPPWLEFEGEAPLDIIELVGNLPKTYLAGKVVKHPCGRTELKLDRIVQPFDW